MKAIKLRNFSCNSLVSTVEDVEILMARTEPDIAALPDTQVTQEEINFPEHMVLADRGRTQGVLIAIRHGKLSVIPLYFNAFVGVFCDNYKSW